MTRRLGRIVAGRWFTPAPPARLAALRLAVAGYSLFYLARRRRMLAALARSEPDLFAPVGACRVLRGPLPPRVVDATTTATLAANAAVLAGVAHPLTGPAFAGLSWWTWSYRNSWSMVFHNDNLLVLHTLTVGMSKAADAMSLDALVQRRLAGGPASPRYGWPIQLMNATTAAAYLVAGVAKLRGPLGWRWADGTSLRRQVAIDGLRKEVFGSAAAPGAYALYRHVGLFRLAAAGSLAIEVLAPLALTHRRVGRLWALGALGMHWGILALMRIKFRYQLSGVAFAPFFDIERPLAALARRLTR